MAQQMSLIDPIDTSRKAARAAALKHAKERGERMATLAAEKVDYLHADYCREAVERLRELAKRTHPGAFSIETARLAINMPLPLGGDARCWGRITQQALKLGYIEHVPGRWERAASSHGAPKGMYRWKKS